MWTHFWDMHSGGGQKEAFAHCFLEAPEQEAKLVFYNRFRHNPERVSCTCCGADYAISESPTLAHATAYHRNCYALETPRGADGHYLDMSADAYFQEHYYLEMGEEPAPGYRISSFPRFGAYQTLERFLKRKDVCVIYEQDIHPGERVGTMPQQGYVWVD